MTTITTDTDATHILTNDHHKMAKLFPDNEGVSGPNKKSRIAGQICNELKIHTIIEEEIFYPSLEGKDDGDLLKEAYVEHDGAKLRVNEIAEGSPHEELLDAKATVLKELIELHVKEGEKQHENMFQHARAAEVDLHKIGQQMLDREVELKQIARAKGLRTNPHPDPEILPPENPQETPPMPEEPTPARPDEIEPVSPDIDNPDRGPDEAPPARANVLFTR